MKPYELSFSAREDLPIQSLHLELKLDGVGRVVTRHAFASSKQASQAFSELPKTFSVKGSGKVLFSGELCSARTSGLNRFELEYRDGSDLLNRIYESEFVKGQRLEDFLKTVAGLVDYRPCFQGKFSQDLPGFDLAGRSFFEHLIQLGSEYGFFFFPHSATKELVFVALGAHRKESDFDGTKTAIRSLEALRRSDGIFAAAEVLAFDPQEGQAKKIEISANAIYEPLGVFKDSPTFKERMGWKPANGRRETVAPSHQDPDKARQSLVCALSKRSMQGEQLTLSLFEHVGFPGDRLDVKLGREKALDGKYLIQQLQMRLDGARPQYDVVLGRA